MSKLKHVCSAYSKLRLDLGPQGTWNELIKRTIGRFARGSIAAQNCRVLLPDEQRAEHARSQELAKNWNKRHKAVA